MGQHLSANGVFDLNVYVIQVIQYFCLGYYYIPSTVIKSLLLCMTIIVKIQFSVSENLEFSDTESLLRRKGEATPVALRLFVRNCGQLFLCIYTVT